MKTMITLNDVKKLWRVKIGYYYMEENRSRAWMEFKRYCLQKQWDLEKAYEYLTVFKWYKR